MEHRLAVIFAGAGASAAVDHEQYPTTLDFYNRLPAKLKAHRFNESLRSWLNSESNVDVEIVLWALYELEMFLEALHSAKEFPLFLLRNDHLTQWLKGGTERRSIGNTLRDYPRLMPELTSLRREINDKVHDFYSELPTQERLEWYSASRLSDRACYYKLRPCAGANA
jgi:hypothetical protein